jgi:hypothetical protein
MKFIKKTKKSTIRRINKSKKQRGGEPQATFIAEGKSSCVYSPPLKCNRGTCNPSTDNRCTYSSNTISKLMRRKTALKEKENDYLLSKIGYDTDFKYHLRPPIMCPVNMATLVDSEKDKCSLLDSESRSFFNQLLLYDNGGRDFFYALYESDVLEDLDPSFILGENGLLNILRGIIELNGKNLSHRDLNEENTLLGIGTTKKMTFIDFGLLSIINQNQEIVISSNANTNSARERTSKELDGLTVLFGEKAYGNIDHGHKNYFRFVKIHHPISSFFLGYNFSNIPKTQRGGWERKIREYVQSFMNPIFNDYESYIYNEIRPFYEYLEIWDEEILVSMMMGLYDIFNQEKFRQFHDSLKLMIAQNLDLYSFGVLLLKYASVIQEKINSGEITDDQLSIYEDIPKKIYKFLKEKSILYPVPALLIHNRSVLDTPEIVTSTTPSELTRDFKTFITGILEDMNSSIISQ